MIKGFKLSSLGPRSGNRGSRVNKETTFITAGFRAHAQNDNKTGVRAFTLIELLVVVLIIGILSAIALPQYQKAVTKARFTQGKILTHAIANAEEIYYLANQEYTADLQNLDVQAPAVAGWSCNVRATGAETSAQCAQPGKLQYMIYLNHADASLAGKRICVARNRDLSSVENEICKADTANSTYGTQTEGSYTWVYQ